MNDLPKMVERTQKALWEWCVISVRSLTIVTRAIRTTARNKVLRERDVCMIFVTLTAIKKTVGLMALGPRETHIQIIKRFNGNGNADAETTRLGQ